MCDRQCFCPFCNGCHNTCDCHLLGYDHDREQENKCPMCWDSPFDCWCLHYCTQCCTV